MTCVHHWVLSEGHPTKGKCSKEDCKEERMFSGGIDFNELWGETPVGKGKRLASRRRGAAITAAKRTKAEP